MTKLGRKAEPEEPEAIANLIVEKFRNSRDAPDVYNGIWSIEMNGIEIWVDLSKAFVYPNTAETVKFQKPTWGSEHVIPQDTFDTITEQWFILSKEYGMVWGRTPIGNWDVFKPAWDSYLESMGVTWDDWQIEMAIKLEQENLEDQDEARYWMGNQ